MKRTILAALAAALLFANPVDARRAAFSWTLRWQVLQSPVEQESVAFPVGNPTGCDWDVDDSTQWQGFGSVSAGQSFGKSFCVIADGYDNTGGDQHRVEARIVTDTPNVTITFANDRGVSYTASPTPSGNKGWEWLFCERDTTDYGQPVGFYPVIAGSNGGTGELVTYTVGVTVGAIHGSTSLEIDTSTGNSGPYLLGC